MKQSAGRAMVITCEHGGKRIPRPYRDLFRSCQALVDSHRGFDPGALIMARALAKALEAPLLAATVSRLLVDLNRSLGHPQLHGEMLRTLSPALRASIVERYYQPYRIEAERLVRGMVARGDRVIHISCHSFTPQLHGVVRNADIGLLYDPAQPGEAQLCATWKAALKACAPDLAVRRNYPYAGRNDGLTSWFRKRLAADTYTGIELEINQKHVIGAGQHWRALRGIVIVSLQTALAGYRS